MKTSAANQLIITEKPQARREAAEWTFGRPQPQQSWGWGYKENKNLFSLASRQIGVALTYTKF